MDYFFIRGSLCRWGCTATCFPTACVLCEMICDLFHMFRGGWRWCVLHRCVCTRKVTLFCVCGWGVVFTIGSLRSKGAIWDYVGWSVLPYGPCMCFLSSLVFSGCGITKGAFAPLWGILVCFAFQVSFCFLYALPTCLAMARGI